MAGVVEGAGAHAAAVVAEGQLVVRLAPAEGLGSCEDGGLLLLVVVADLAVLAPARLVLALSAVLGAVGRLVLHLVDVVKASGVGLSVTLLGGGSRDNRLVTEVVDVRVLRVELFLQRFNLCLDCSLGLASLFL